MVLAHVAGVPVEEALPAAPAAVAALWLAWGALRARLRSLGR